MLRTLLSAVLLSHGFRLASRLMVTLGGRPARFVLHACEEHPISLPRCVDGPVYMIDPRWLAQLSPNDPFRSYVKSLRAITVCRCATLAPPEERSIKPGTGRNSRVDSHASKAAASYVGIVWGTRSCHLIRDLSDGRPEMSRRRTPRIDDFDAASLKIRHVACGEGRTAEPGDRRNLSVGL